MSNVTLAGKPIELAGAFPTSSQRIPNTITFTNQQLNDITLEEYSGKRKILNIFPSLDTPTCSTSVRKFNQRASLLENAVVLCISSDLPFAQTRFCETEGLKNVVALSTFRHKETLQSLGILITSGPLAGLAARGVIILDQNNTVIYSQLVSEIKSEPDYDQALSVL